MKRAARAYARWFRGLPSPGKRAAVAGWVCLAVAAAGPLFGDGVWAQTAGGAVLLGVMVFVLVDLRRWTRTEGVRR